MRDDITKHLANMLGAIEELLAVYNQMSESKRLEMDTRLEEKIKNLQNIIKWSKNG
jgi:hypothetical protein